jgi:hypothetical protein
MLAQLLVAGAQSLPLSSSLSDFPMAGSAVFYLDGDDWEAVGSGRQYNSNWTDPTQWPRQGGCTWEEGVDYPSALGPATKLAYGMNKQTCCELCAATESCAAAVYTAPAPTPPKPPAPPVPPSTDCKFMNETDFHPESGMIADVPSANSTECCARCRVTEGCAVAVQYGGTCYMKDSQSVGKNYSRPGRMGCVPNSDCTFTQNIDYHPDTVITSIKLPAGQGSGACCDLCRKQEGCVVGVLYSGTCYLKGATDMTTNYSRAGRTVCRPDKTATAHAAAALPTENGVKAGEIALPRDMVHGSNCHFKTAADLAHKVAKPGRLP